MCKGCKWQKMPTSKYQKNKVMLSIAWFIVKTDDWQSFYQQTIVDTFSGNFNNCRIHVYFSLSELQKRHGWFFWRCLWRNIHMVRKKLTHQEMQRYNKMVITWGFNALDSWLSYYQYKSVSLVHETFWNSLSWSTVIIIGEQQTKQSSVYCCWIMELSRTISTVSPQLGQSIGCSSSRLISV